MKKCGLFVFCMLISALLLSSCSIKSVSPIKYERKFGKYIEPQQSTGTVIDLSEGPKLKYNANFGPKELNFDIKIVNPY